MKFSEVPPLGYRQPVVTALLGFAAASVLIVLLPGPDTLVVVRNLLRGGRRRAAATVVGVLSGLVIWVAAASLGLSAVLRASHTGYDVLRYVGGAYLIYVGIQSLRSRAALTDGGGDVHEMRRYGPLLGSGYFAGLATDLLNPKVGVFFVTFLPAFVPRGADVGATTLALGAVFVVETLLYFIALIGVADRVVSWMTDARTRRRLDRGAGLVFIGFGLRLATEN
ncbi:MAG TPA: LysE family translocator [Mycobacteriales bacterium]|nr:LysE family translocator [Mycobacteriales bacterium]